MIEVISTVKLLKFITQPPELMITATMNIGQDFLPVVKISDEKGKKKKKS